MLGKNDQAGGPEIYFLTLFALTRKTTSIITVKQSYTIHEYQEALLLWRLHRL